jgi:hypothetical protein
MSLQPRPRLSDSRIPGGLEANPETIPNCLPCGVLPFSDEPNRLNVIAGKFVAVLIFSNVKRWFCGCTSLYRIIVVCFVGSCVKVFRVATDGIVAGMARHFSFWKRAVSQLEGYAMHWDWPSKSEHGKLNSRVELTPFCRFKPWPAFFRVAPPTTFYTRPKLSSRLECNLIMVARFTAKVPLVLFESVSFSLEWFIAVVAVHFHKPIVCHF